MSTFLRILAVISLALPLASCGASCCKGEKAAHDEAFKRISAVDLNNKLIAKEPVFVFDQNGAERFGKGHIPTAKLLLVEDVSTTTLPADKAAFLVFYCGSDKCTACHHAADAAIALGYTNVWIMPEGIKGWEAQKLPVE
jgi:rhodanese-related sulfurtransferase